MQAEGKQDGLVSIIMPSYNSEKYIVAAIKSVQAQTYENWELIVVDDCSTDSTVDIQNIGYIDLVCSMEYMRNWTK